MSLAGPQLVEPTDEPNNLLHAPPSTTLLNADPYTSSSKSYHTPSVENSSLSSKSLESLTKVDVTLPSLNRTDQLFTSARTEQLGKVDMHLGPSIDHQEQFKDKAGGKGSTFSAPTHNHFYTPTAERELESKVQVCFVWFSFVLNQPTNITCAQMYDTWMWYCAWICVFKGLVLCL